MRSANAQGSPNFRFPEDPRATLPIGDGKILGNTSGYICELNNPQCLDCCVESCDHTLAVYQAAAFAAFYFNFDNGAAVVLAACFTAAQRLICA